MTKFNIILIVLFVFLLISSNSTANNGSICGLSLSFYRYGIEINNYDINEGDNIEVDEGSNLIVVIERCNIGSSPFYCCLISEYNSYVDCNNFDIKYPWFIWNGSYPCGGNYLWGASVDDDIWNFHVSGSGWFDVTKPAENETLKRNCSYNIEWEPNVHCGSSCNEVSIWLCKDDETDDDEIIPVVHEIASHVDNNGQYNWHVDSSENEDDRYRIMVICGAAEGYSEMFVINGTCKPDLKVDNFHISYEENYDNDGIVESTDRFTIKASFVIRNIGESESETTNYLIKRKEFSDCSSQVGATAKYSGDIVAMGPGSSKVYNNIVIDTNVPRGIYEYWIIIDPNNLIDESDESNNSNGSCDDVIKAENCSWGAIKRIYK